VIDSQLPLDLDILQNPNPVNAKLKPLSKPRRTATHLAAAMPSPQEMAALLEAHPDYRVLRRLAPIHHFDRVAQGPVKRILILDTETTGLDQSRDKIIELAMLRVDVDTATGLPVGAVTVYDGLEDPGVLISPEIEKITGITSAMVQGQRLDEAKIAALLADADLVIAHNAGFDRPFCEARWPGFAQLPWGCSFAEIDWRKEGHGSAKLEYLAMEKGWFYEAHRAEVDCHALLAVLGAPLPTAGGTGLSQILAASNSCVYRLQANQAPFDAKDLLKARAYRWNAEQKVWHTRLADEAQLEAELVWLKSAVYGERAAWVQVEKMDALVKYSSRHGELVNRQI
jgi:DNA polymerase-3 subunit epsilon